MTTARQPRPPRSWRIQDHCDNPRCRWACVVYVDRTVALCREYRQAVDWIAAHPNGPDRETR